MPDPPLQPPVPFDDFTFAFDPALHGLFPSPPPMPSSADLFSASETTDILGFLDHLNWDLQADIENVVANTADHSAQLAHPPSLLSNRPLDGSSPRPASALRPDPGSRSTHIDPSHSYNQSAPSHQPSAAPTPSDASARPKPLLSTPQKRLNHIMSEQKRRNAIRDGYVQLTALLAPAGAPPGAGMPTRGRPKGSGSRNSGRGNGKGGTAFKGKSGILFRAVEYVQWLEEGRDALLAEVLKVEAAAGIRHA
ncbi:hypothetical protein BXZ70DRAFT_287254 [Cristinia sonorae]|uniref:BHLH domain-containing protein n=1 Tax=Cristinia sonorae TaxID=1940300 RepID=A0A8K0UKY4_9AGAR|nr:hypothetical protein BXZ70DRAFT_287254 [Cristinia sonorae]